MKESIRKGLIDGDFKIGIWGLGYIGYSSAAYFAKVGISSLGTDILKHRVDDINRGHETIPNLELWLGFKIKPLVERGLIKATLNWKNLIKPNIPVHLVAIPTEKKGVPCDHILKDVVIKLCEFKKVKMPHIPLVIIESTLTPNKVDEVVIPLFKENGMIVGKDILLGVAPRRDWFISAEKTLVTLPRVIGGTNKTTTKIIDEVLSLVCQTVVKSKDHKHAEMVKSVENAYRQMDIALANQLSRAYPNVDIDEVLKLVGTKWNIGTFYPSFGTGGYCIPLAPQYVLEGAENPDELSLLKESIKTDLTQPERVVKSLIKKGAKKVGVLGIAYKEDIPVAVLSPAIPIIKKLQENNVMVKLYDPYFNDKERVRKATSLDVDLFKFPEGLSEFDTVLIVAGHSEFRFTNTSKIVKSLKKCRLIIDNSDVWSGIAFGNKVKYYKTGNKGWL